MPTILQERLAEKIIENAKRKKPKGKTELVASVGYSGNMARANAGRAIECKGVKEALKARGFNPDNAKRVLGELLDNPEERSDIKVRVAQEIFKVSGTYAPEKSVHLDITATHSDKYTQLLDDVEARMLAQAEDTPLLD